MPDKTPALTRALRQAKDRLFAKLAPLDWISGVGLSGSKLQVYVTRTPTKQESDQLKAICAAEAPGQEFECVAAGSFEKR